MRTLFLVLLLATAALARPSVPPGPNVHYVANGPGGLFWRGGAPRQATLQALHERGKATFVDLRHPANSDDRSGKDGRLSPIAEERQAHQLGLDYLSISALDPHLVERIDQALEHGDVYIHCMYGVNRTGFAIGRWATAHGQKVDRAGLGRHDYADGAAFEPIRGVRDR